MTPPGEASRHDSGTLSRVPNTPGTPRRTIRIDAELWAAAKARAAERGEDLSDVIRAALRRYVKRKGAGGNGGRDE